MAAYKNGRTAVEGDNVTGADAAGKPVSGVVVTIHPPFMGVSQNFNLIGDLKPSDFLHVEDVKVTTAKPSKPVPVAEVPKE